MLITFERMKLQLSDIHFFNLNGSAFQIPTQLFCAVILTKVINNFVGLGNIFEHFENRKMLISFDRMMGQKKTYV